MAYRTRNLGMCCDRKSNPQPFRARENAQPTKPHGPGLSQMFSKSLHYPACLHPTTHMLSLRLILGLAHPLPSLRPSSICLPTFPLKSENRVSTPPLPIHSFTPTANTADSTGHLTFPCQLTALKPLTTDATLMVSTSLTISFQIPSSTPFPSLPSQCPQPPSHSLLTLPG